MPRGMGLDGGGPHRGKDALVGLGLSSDLGLHFVKDETLELFIMMRE